MLNEHLNTLLISPGDEGGHSVGESNAREYPGDDGGGAEHSRRRRVPRLHGSGKECNFLLHRMAMVIWMVIFQAVCHSVKELRYIFRVCLTVGLVDLELEVSPFCTFATESGII